MMDGAEAGLGRLRVRSEEVDAAGAGAGRKAVENAVERRLRPLEVHVSGRVGVGKSVIVSVLDAARLHTDGFEVRLHESGWADIPRAAEVQQRRTASDVDVLVHVLAGAVSPDDITFLSARPGGPPAHTVILLNKADTLDEPAATAAAASEQLGRKVLPVMGSVAAGLGGAARGFAVDMADVRAVAAGALRTGDLMTVDRFLSADIPLSTPRREALLDRVELRGLALLVEALRRRSGVSDADVLRELWEATGVDAVTTVVSDTVSAAATARDDDLHEQLLQISARHRDVRGAVESYLASDEAVAADMRCAAARLAVPIETGSEQALLEQALVWKRCAATSEDDSVRRSALALCRGYVRMLRP
ncbi:hypothetical protein [Rhodococcoides fascians]|uniref:hypothetical protein n=2 Tax=Nocardiaceae TaxID=85025 RepID=UPI0012D3631B|nr:hypothetical protein [Rhodococcus fascians]